MFSTISVIVDPLKLDHHLRQGKGEQHHHHPGGHVAEDVGHQLRR
jgi:hypothetical protein